MLTTSTILLLIINFNVNNNCCRKWMITSLVNSTTNHRSSPSSCTYAPLTHPQCTSKKRVNRYNSDRKQTYIFMSGSGGQGSHPSDRIPFPLEFRNHNAVLENHTGRASRPWKKVLWYLFSRLDTIPACDIQPSTHPASHFSTASTRYTYLRRAVKMESRVS